MFLKLPAELRLRIAEYALEQRPAAGIPHIGRHLQEYRNDYRPSENLALLLVCRQFNIDFTSLAYNKTRFTLWTDEHGARMQELPSYKLRSIRKLAYYPNEYDMESWGNFFHNLEQLRLDELVLFCSHTWTVGLSTIKIMVLFLRRLQHVKRIKFVLYGKMGTNRSAYCSLIGAMMKEDHYQRYDAPGAPKVEATWWDWHLNTHENLITLRAQGPRPVLPEEEYMILMKPKVDALMAEAERVAGL